MLHTQTFQYLNSILIYTHSVAKATAHRELVCGWNRSDVIGILGVSNFEASIFLCNGSGQTSIDELAKLLLLLLIKLNLEVSVNVAIRLWKG